MKGRVALVTGSATGLGVQTVLALASAGHDIIINYRSNQQRAQNVKEQVENFGVRCEIIQADIANPQHCEKLVRESVHAFGTIDILVLNAGPYVFDRKKMVDYSTEEWNFLINGNLNSFFYLTKEVIPMMRTKRWGRIITFGFHQAGQAAGWGYRSGFAAAKVGLASLTRTIAEEESESGITINMICPGDITGDNKEKTIAEVQHIKSHVAPIGRPGSGEDIARVVSFLCSADSDFITGSIFEVNGGFNVLTKRIMEQEDIE